MISVDKKALFKIVPHKGQNKHAFNQPNGGNTARHRLERKTNGFYILFAAKMFVKTKVNKQKDKCSGSD